MKKKKGKGGREETKRAPRVERVPRDRSAIHLRLSSRGKKVRNLAHIHMNTRVRMTRDKSGSHEG